MLMIVKYFMQDGNHPLSYATVYNRPDLVQLLLRFNATIDQETDVSHFYVILMSAH